VFLKRWEDDVFISVCLSVRLSVRQNYSKNCHKLSSIFWRVGSYYKESSIRLLWWSGPESGRLSDTTVLPHSPGDVLFLINLFPLMIKSTLLCCKLIPSFPKSTQSSNVVLYRKVGKMQHRLHCLRVTPGFHHYATRSTAPQTFSVRQKRRKKVGSARDCGSQRHANSVCMQVESCCIFTQVRMCRRRAGRIAVRCVSEFLHSYANLALVLAAITAGL